MTEYSLGWCFIKSGHVVSRMYTRSLITLGVSCSQAMVIVTLSLLAQDERFPTQSELAQSLFIDKVSVHQLIKGLNHKSIVTLQKKDGDRRSHMIKLTIKGRYYATKIQMIDKQISSYLSNQFFTHAKEILLSSMEQFLLEESFRGGIDNEDYT